MVYNACLLNVDSDPIHAVLTGCALIETSAYFAVGTESTDISVSSQSINETLFPLCISIVGSFGDFAVVLSSLASLQNSCSVGEGEGSTNPHALWSYSWLLTLVFTMFSPTMNLFVGFFMSSPMNCRRCAFAVCVGNFCFASSHVLTSTVEVKASRIGCSCFSSLIVAAASVKDILATSSCFKMLILSLSCEIENSNCYTNRNSTCKYNYRPLGPETFWSAAV